ncbi:MAG: thymidylate synthase (FAD) [Rickettsiales bacterium]|nr:thymidylate synthase (FAD) [Rickettsiales bacterium]
MNKKLQERELNQLRKKTHTTLRATVKNIENILYKKFNVLDHGFIRVIDYMGDDSSIVQAARVSYGKGTKKINQDKSLINYLLSHRHSTPFEMNEIKLHIKLPIFVARQWIRQRTANVNEYSARYSILDREFYMPKPEHFQAQSKSNNQGREISLDNSEMKSKLKILKENSNKNFDNYSFLLNEDESGNIINPKNQGIARELARMTLPLNTYTQWYWKIDLHNLMHFLSLRFDPHAQYEIRVYAEVMLKILQKWVPLTFDAFCKHRMHSFTISSQGINYIKSIISGQKFNKEKISKRELDEINKKLNIDNN